MQWQDWVVSIGQLILVLALVPTILGSHKPALSTSVATAVILGSFSITFYTLGLLSSTVTSALASASWALLAYQKYRQTKKI